MFESLAENCCRVSSLWSRRLNDALKNVIFPELVELHIDGELDKSESYATFLPRQPKLKILEMSVGTKKTLLKLSTMLPNLIELTLHAELNEAHLKKLLLAWRSFKKLRFSTYNELDLEAMKRAIPRDVVVLQD
jgi:hypothetical protein